MSSYLELLQKLNGYGDVQDLLAADGESVLTGLNNLFGLSGINGNTRDEQFTPNITTTGAGSVGFNPRQVLYESQDFFTNGDLLTYPQDLFQPGNTAYIYFQIKDSQAAIVKQTSTEPLDPSAGSDAKPLKRIALYMPPGVKVSYGTKWDDANLSIRKSVGLGKELFSGDTAETIKQVAARFGDAIVGGEGFLNDTEFANKKILDPQAALLFKGVNFRDFQFDFQMLARNKEESQRIRQIIKCFKYAMHPGTTESGGAIWEYPYFFEIYLCSPSTKYMFNIMNSALVQMEVDYGGSGIPSFFRENGAPVDIRMSLQFKELFVLTKKMILNDY